MIVDDTGLAWARPLVDEVLRSLKS